MSKTLSPQKPLTDRLRSHVPAAFCSVWFIMVAGPAFAQTQHPTSREIVAEDFTKNRPKTSPLAAGGGAISNQPASGRKSQEAPKVKKRVYRLAATTAQSLPSTSVVNSPINKLPSTRLKFEQLGITIWRLRPARSSDAGARMLVMEKANSTEWVPERIQADTPINFGDRVRISIESPRTGYLYVVDREMYSDGSKGDAYLIFPTLRTRSGDNKVTAGKLIDIPGEEDPPFKATRNRPDQVGELLSVIVTTSPLELPISDNPLKISASDIAKWEETLTTEIERFELVGGAGQTWTKEEKDAAAGAGARQLTQDEPTPQTIYRLGATNNVAFLVNVLLRYGR